MGQGRVEERDRTREIEGKEMGQEGVKRGKTGEVDKGEGENKWDKGGYGKGDGINESGEMKAWKGRMCTEGWDKGGKGTES